MKNVEKIFRKANITWGRLLKVEGEEGPCEKSIAFANKIGLKEDTPITPEIIALAMRQGKEEGWYVTTWFVRLAFEGEFPELSFKDKIFLARAYPPDASVYSFTIEDLIKNILEEYMAKYKLDKSALMFHEDTPIAIGKTIFPLILKMAGKYDRTVYNLLCGKFIDVGVVLDRHYMISNILTPKQKWLIARKMKDEFWMIRVLRDGKDLAQYQILDISKRITKDYYQEEIAEILSSVGLSR